MNMKPELLSEIGRAAADYARAQGWHVFPAPPGKKQSYEGAADNDGRRWGATDDPETAMLLFAKHPGANVGIACQKSGLVVLDLDVKNGADGVAWLAGKIEEHGNWPETVEAMSPSGSWHVYFRYPGDFDPKTCESEIAPGVDVRGHGGIVIAPPSSKPGAEKPYRWKNPPGLFDVAEAPNGCWISCPVGSGRLRCPRGRRRSLLPAARSNLIPADPGRARRTTGGCSSRPRPMVRSMARPVILLLRLRRRA